MKNIGDQADTASKEAVACCGKPGMLFILEHS
jgi:hypothetical protein